MPSPGLLALPAYPWTRRGLRLPAASQDAPFGVAAMHPDDIRVATATTGTAVSVPKPPRLRDGDGVLFLVYDQVAASTVTQSNSGMTEAYHVTAASSRGFYLFTKANVTAASEPSSYTATLSNSGRWVALVMRVPQGYTTLVDAVPTSDTYTGSAGNTLNPPAVTSAAPGALGLALLFANGTSNIVSTFTAPGWALVANPSVNNAGSTSAVNVLQKTFPNAGSSVTDTFTADQNYASAGGFVITLAPIPAPSTGTISPTGIPSAEAFGVPSLADLVTRWLSLTPFYAAHRDGCWGTYGEETLAGYAFAASWFPDLALEVSVWRTTDGVWVCSHDQTTARVFSGTSLDITTSTWASLSGKTTLVGGNPIARLDDVLAAQATGNRVFLIDDKGQQDTTGLLDLLDSYGGKFRFIAKGYINSTTWADAAAARGYTTWGYGFQADVTGPGSVIGATPNNYSTNQGHWSTLSMNWDAASAAWTYALSFGKLLITDELATAAQKATALSLGASGIMGSDVTQTVPNVSTPGIATGEALGTPTVTLGAATVSPSGITSAEAFGTATVTTGPVTISPTGIPSAEAFGAATVTTGPVTVTPSGIATGEAVGAAVVTPGPVTLTPTGITTAGAFGTAVVTPGPVSIVPSGIVSTETIGTATITTGPVTLTPTGIASAGAVGNPVVSAGGSILAPTGITSGEGFGTATVTPGPVTITPTGVASGQAFGSASVATGPLTLSPAGIGSSEALGAATVTPGAVVITPTGITTAAAFGAPALVVVLHPDGVTTGELFGTPTVAGGSSRVLVIAVTVGNDRWQVTTGADRWQVTTGSDRWRVTQEAPA